LPWTFHYGYFTCYLLKIKISLNVINTDKCRWTYIWIFRCTSHQALKSLVLDFISIYYEIAWKQRCNKILNINFFSFANDKYKHHLLQYILGKNFGVFRKAIYLRYFLTTTKHFVYVIKNLVASKKYISC